jgi:hypothetical protein
MLLLPHGRNCAPPGSATNACCAVERFARRRKAQEGRRPRRADRSAVVSHRGIAGPGCPVRRETPIKAGCGHCDAAVTRGRNGRRGGKRHRLHLRAQTLRSRSIARIRSIPGAVGSAAIVGRRCAIELGTRAFELLLALLEANGSLVSKEQLLTRVWPGIAVAEHNVKVHVCALRKALGEHHDYVRTEFGRGYRFIGAVRSTVPWGSHHCPMWQRYRSTQRLCRRRITRRPSHGWPVNPCLDRDFDLARCASAAFCGDQTA